MRSGQLPRRRIQRAFFKWLNEKNDSLPFPLVVVQRTDSKIVCRILGITHAIRISLTYDLCVYAERDGEIWDTLVWLDCLPQKQCRHYVCRLCYADDQECYDSREALWRAQLFEPLSAWLTSLTSATWLLFFQISPNGSTCARLDTDYDPDDLSCLVEKIPIHCTRHSENIHAL